MLETETPVLKSGCSLYPDCFTCPYDDCVASDKNFRVKYHRLPKEERVARNHAIKKELDSGVSTTEIRAKYGISGSHILRIKKGDCEL